MNLERKYTIRFENKLIVFGIRIIWSGNRFCPPRVRYNRFGKYTYRYCPYLKILRKKSKEIWVQNFYTQ